VDRARDVFSVYADAEYEVSDTFLVDGAVRYVNYDGFGDTVYFKLAAKFVLNDTVTLRGAVCGEDSQGLHSARAASLRDLAMLTRYGPS
jgi:outer membrane cobalamin receptor